MIHQDKIAAGKCALNSPRESAEKRVQRRHDLFLSRMGTMLGFGFFALLLASILIAFTIQRENLFQDQQFELRKTLLSNTALEVSHYIGSTRRDLQDFVILQQNLLRQLRVQPQDANAYATLEKRIRDRYKASTAFMIIDENGAPIWMDFGFVVGPKCQLEINHFSDEVKHSSFKAKNQVSIHPNLSHYHFDIMAAWPLNPVTNNVLSLSFDAGDIAATLERRQQPGHQLMIVRKDDAALIEISAAGSRDKLHRDIRLSSAELKQLHTFADVEGTDWRVVDLIDQAVFDQYNRKLWINSAMLGLLLLALSVFVVAAIKVSVRTSK